MKRFFLVLFILALAGAANAAYTSGTLTSVVHTTYANSIRTSDSLQLEVDTDGAYELLEVRIHLNASGTTETLTVDIDSILGSSYDFVLATQAMTSLANYNYLPTRPIICLPGDMARVSVANAAKKTIGAIIIWRRL
jgi:opacity protein-like surface antigen